MPQSASDAMVIVNAERKMSESGNAALEADFSQLTFEKGTRLHVVQLQFKQQVKVEELVRS